MSLEVTVNLNSLRMIRELLDATISQSATDFEAYLADLQATDYLTASHEKIAQVSATLRLIELPGAALIAEEMASVMDAMTNTATKTSEAMINAITHAYFVLPRYLEYITLKQLELPIMIMPYVNELRASRRAELLPEFYCYDIDIPTLGLMEYSHSETQLNTLLATAPRLRHMYQTGLIGVIKNPDSSFHFQFMRRAISRFINLLGDHPQAEIWQIASAALETFVSAKLEVTLSRKRILADIEKMLRQVTSFGEQGLNSPPSNNLKKDLLFLVMMTSVSRPEIDKVRTAYSLPTLSLGDVDIVKEREAMHGPTLETIDSVVNALYEELRGGKDILEIASQNDAIEPEDQELLLGVLRRVSETLGIINLHGPQKILMEQLDKASHWALAADQNTRNNFLEVADAILYVESALSGLNRRELTVDELNRASELARKKVVANSQLAVAEKLVLEEAQSAIAMAKRAVTSYVDSNFDLAHIANISTTLASVRGGMYVLNHKRAASILDCCSRFIESHTKLANVDDKHHQLLETLADAFISLEYYLVELESTRVANDKILDVAEESLAALGFSPDSQ